MERIATLIPLFVTVGFLGCYAYFGLGKSAIKVARSLAVLCFVMLGFGSIVYLLTGYNAFISWIPIISCLVSLFAGASYFAEKFDQVGFFEKNKNYSKNLDLQH